MEKPERSGWSVLYQERVKARAVVPFAQDHEIPQRSVREGCGVQCMVYISIWEKFWPSERPKSDWCDFPPTTLQKTLGLILLINSASVLPATLVLFKKNILFILVVTLCIKEARKNLSFLYSVSLFRKGYRLFVFIIFCLKL